MHVLTYVRVSTDKQAEKELSLPAQLLACRQYAVQRNWQIIEEFIEPGASARTADRPELKRLLSRCRDAGNPVGAVIVHKLDRLARNLADHVAIRGVLSKHGVKLVSVTENLDDSVSGQLVEHIMASIAEFYSANLGEEVKKGIRGAHCRSG
jgi:site-specific DNA recombinase